jgi:hypothetical protein
MVYLSQYEISTNGRAVVLPGGFELLRVQIDGALLVRGPRGSAGTLVKLENVLAVRELDDYVIDLQNGQATVKQGELLTKSPAAAQQENKSFPIILMLEIGIALYILVKVVLK